MMSRSRTQVVLGVPVEVPRFTDTCVTGEAPNLNIEHAAWSPERIREWRLSRFRIWDDAQLDYGLTVVASAPAPSRRFVGS